MLLTPLFMALVAMSVINVGLPAIQESFGTTSTGVQWTISGYTLAFALLLVPAGRIGDASGRRRMLIIGVAVFTVGSLLSAVAPTIDVLNLARVLQGVGSGLLNPQSVGIIQQNFVGQARAKAFALFGTTVALATAIGPVIGGLLIQVFGPETGWRLMFGMNVPLGVLTVVLAFLWLPDDRARSGTRIDLDPVGVVLLSVGLVSMMLPFLERGRSPLLWLQLPLGLAIVAVWVWWERRYKQRDRSPMVDIDIFRSEAFRNGIIIVGVYFVGSTSIWIVVPLFLQTHLGHTPFEAALVGLPASLAAAVTSQVAGRYVLRLGRRLVIAGFATAIAALVGTAALAPAVEQHALSFWWFALPLTLVGASQGMTISPNQTLTLKAVDPRYGGVAGGILQLGQRIGAAIGTALIPGVLFSLTEGGFDWLEAFVIVLGIIAALALGALIFSARDRARERAEQAG